MTAPLPISSVVVPTSVIDTSGLYSVGTFPTARTAFLTLPLIALSPDESELVSKLQTDLLGRQFAMKMSDAYFRGEQVVRDLGISVPPQMRGLHTTIGWPRVGIEALDRRLIIDGFRYPDSDDVDKDLDDIWIGNDMDAEHSMGNLDALVFGSGFVGVGSPAVGGNVIDTPPLITVESPLDVAVQWDARTRGITAALRLYGPQGAQFATLYLPNQTVSLEQASAAGWTVVHRDIHNQGRVLIERIPNRSRSYDRNGFSEITPEIRSLTDAACRTLLSLAVAGEFYSAPQRWIMGVGQDAFVNADNTPKTAWETYLGRVWAVDSDPEAATLPTVGQFQAYDPSVFTKVLDQYAQRMSSLTGLPPHILGFATENPTSADAIRSSEMELTRRADQKTVAFGKAWRNVMKMALSVRGGPQPANVNQIETVWQSTATPTLAATSDAIGKQIASGYLPYNSDVAGEMYGYNAAKRARIEADRAKNPPPVFAPEPAIPSPAVTRPAPAAQPSGA